MTFLGTTASRARCGAILILAGALSIALAFLAPAAHADPTNAAGRWWHRHGFVEVTTTSSSTTTTSDNAYAPHDVGDPAQNGNGDGNAIGEPCAGCVGNADDKNPPGQFHDGHDHNNGYECDGNAGHTNPAHSGCLEPTTTTEAPTTTTTTVALTTTTVGGSTTTVGGPTTTAGPSVLGEELVRGSGFARTGSAFPIWGLALGLLLIAAGATLVTGERRRTSA